MTVKDSLCIIPARAGSKRIPKKNIKIFIDRPIIAHSIQNAIESKEFDTVMVSTDSKEIADISASYGAEIPFFRSETNSSDYATTADVLLEVIEKYINKGIKYKYICCIYPCTPLLTVDMIKYGMILIRSNEYDMTLPLVSYSHPPQRAYTIENDQAHILYKENFPKRTQDFQKLYYDAGQFYCFKCDSLLKKKISIYTEDKIKPIIFNEENIHDIDTLSDWSAAEIKYQLIHRTKYTDEFNIGYHF